MLMGARSYEGIERQPGKNFVTNKPVECPISNLVIMQALQYPAIRAYARTGGILYFVLILVGMFAVLLVRDRLIVSGDAAATAQNLIAHQQLWQAGIVADMLMHLLDIPIMLVIYVLLKPVNKNMALLA